MYCKFLMEYIYKKIFMSSPHKKYCSFEKNLLFSFQATPNFTDLTSLLFETKLHCHKQGNVLTSLKNASSSPERRNSDTTALTKNP